jgi:hypothetical protein
MTTRKDSCNFLGACALVLTCSFFSQIATSATIAASSCQQSDVQSAISSASNGDVVSVPAGNCSWSSMSISDGIHLQGAGSGATNISVSGSITLNKNAQVSLELSGFSFTKSGGSGPMFYVNGSWSAEPPLIHDNVFTVSNAGIFRYQTNGGVMYRNTFRGNLDDSGIQHKIGNDSQSWSTPDTMGVLDIDGKRNLYVEDNVFEGMANAATDFDDASRVVFRYNTLRSSSFNSHGFATSPIGIRHFEIYNNTFLYPDASVNQNWHIWLRGGTGVIFGNSFDDINGQEWGNKTELHLAVRAVYDGSPEGCCTSWPCKHQVGQNHDGSSQFTDPLYIWSNTGTLAFGFSSWSNQCGQNINDYLQEGRDFIFASSAKANYTPYPYPHPLRVDTVRPKPPHSVSVNP